MAALGAGVEELGEEEAADLEAIRARQREIVAGHRLKKAAAGNRPVLPAKQRGAPERTAARLRNSLGSMGIDTSAAEARLRDESRGRKRTRSASAAAQRGGGGGDDVDMADADGSSAPAKKRVHSSKSRSMSRGRALSTAPPAAGSGLKDAPQANKAVKMADRAQRKMNKMVRGGDSGPAEMPKGPRAGASHIRMGKAPTEGVTLAALGAFGTVASRCGLAVVNPNGTAKLSTHPDTHHSPTQPTNQPPTHPTTRRPRWARRTASSPPRCPSGCSRARPRA